MNLQQQNEWNEKYWKIYRDRVREDLHDGLISKEECDRELNRGVELKSSIIKVVKNDETYSLIYQYDAYDAYLIFETKSYTELAEALSILINRIIDHINSNFIALDSLRNIIYYGNEKISLFEKSVDELRPKRKLVIHNPKKVYEIDLKDVQHLSQEDSHYLEKLESYESMKRKIDRERERLEREEQNRIEYLLNKYYNAIPVNQYNLRDFKFNSDDNSDIEEYYSDDNSDMDEKREHDFTLHIDFYDNSFEVNFGSIFYVRVFCANYDSNEISERFNLLCGFIEGHRYWEGFHDRIPEKIRQDFKKIKRYY